MTRKWWRLMTKTVRLPMTLPAFFPVVAVAVAMPMAVALGPVGSGQMMKIATVVTWLGSEPAFKSTSLEAVPAGQRPGVLR